MMWKQQHIAFLLIFLSVVLQATVSYKIRLLRSEPDDTQIDDTVSSEDPDNTDTSEEDDAGDKPTEPAMSTQSVLPQIDMTPTSTLVSGDSITGSTSPPPEEAFFVTSVETNKVCLAVKIEAMFALTSPETMNVEIPGSPETSGHCRPNAPVIYILWQHYNLTLRAEKNEDNWAITLLQLEYNPQEVFKNKTYPKSITLNAKKDDLEGYTAPLKESLTCDREALPLYNNEDKKEADVVFTSLQAQAFNVPSHFGPENKCSVETATESTTPKRKYQSDVAPVAVGSVLAILTLLMLAGYAIYRSMNTKKPDYSTME